MKGTNGLGAKERLLETTTRMRKLRENPKVQVKGTEVLDCASRSESERNQWAKRKGKSLASVEENDKVEVKVPSSWEAQALGKVKGTDRLIAKESRLETAASVWKLKENPKVQIKGTKVLEYASVSQK